MIKKIIFTFGIFIFLALAIANVTALIESTVCCEKTTSGLFCQNVPKEECSANGKQAPTSCDSTAYCRQGTCYNSKEGTCLDNTPEIVCNANGGTWSAQTPPACDLGCCILGDQAAFVTLTRCKYLSSNLGLQTNYNKNIKDELQCVLQVQNQDKGACVFESEYQTTCKFTTREQCGLGFNRTNRNNQFFKDKLCTDDVDFDANCAPTSKTICIPGKDEVYFVDTCGNPANIYDAAMVPDLNNPNGAWKEYWTNAKDKSESCNPNSGNPNSKNCGNCNYLLGSICKATDAGDTKASYGDNICADLNCVIDGKERKHGESWCVYTDKGSVSTGNNAVGSQFFKHICVNGEEVLEACADFRAQECIEDKIKTSVGDFSQAACRVNRWQDCLFQTEKIDCENTDRRDCLWKENLESMNSTNGACVPKNPPGLKFWESEETRTICAQGNAQCIVTFKKGLFGGEECKKNCDCLTESWKKQRLEFCSAIGDCGAKINWIGADGYKSGFNYTINKK